MGLEDKTEGKSSSKDSGKSASKSERSYAPVESKDSDAPGPMGEAYRAMESYEAGQKYGDKGTE